MPYNLYHGDRTWELPSSVKCPPRRHVPHGLTVTWHWFKCATHGWFQNGPYFDACGDAVSFCGECVAENNRSASLQCFCSTKKTMARLTEAS